MLYTRKGDAGTTKTFGCDQRISKSSSVAEALGALDEANSYIGLCRSKSADSGYKIGPGQSTFESVALDIQKNLFIVQAEVAGAKKSIDESKVKEAEILVDSAEKELPKITSFFIPGATELGAHFDVARTLIRRAERRVVAVKEEGSIKVGAHTLEYLNRLSSLLYALARLSNKKGGATEESPDYK